MIHQNDFTATAQGKVMDLRRQSFGELEDASSWVGNPAVLRSRMETNGYLFLRGLLNRDQVLEARKSVVERLARENLLAPGTDPMEAIVRPCAKAGFQPALAKENSALQRILYAGPLIDFYRQFFGEEVLHFDYTWFRAVGPGKGTKPHCDIVYMGRGTRDQLYTAWVPIGDVPLSVGGLMLLEGSHLQQDRLRQYLSRDVDSYCTNRRHAAAIEAGEKNWEWDGALSRDPVSLREKLGGRWLTAEFRAGDVLTFPMHTVHASLDNHSDRIRLSSDSRYQPASQPADERWIGENPVGHSLAGKRGRIC